MPSNNGVAACGIGGGLWAPDANTAHSAVTWAASEGGGSLVERP